MDEKLQEAISLYNKGDKSQASKLFAEIVRHEPNNSVAWYGLALCVDDPERKIYCLQRVLSLDPSNQKARQRLDKLQATKSSISHQQVSETRHTPPVAKRTSSFKHSAVIICGVVGVIIVAILALTAKKPYKPNADDAFSYAAGFALSKMYARDPASVLQNVRIHKPRAGKFKF
jgi:hypothetical protein